MLVPHSRTGQHWSGATGSYNSEAIEQKAISHRKRMGFLKYLNKIGGAKYLFLVRCVLLVPHSRTGKHWSGASGSYNSEAIEQKAISHRKLMGFLKYLNKIGGAKYYFLVRCVLLVPLSRTGQHWSGASGSYNSEAIEQKVIFHRK